jgi:magnesium transporter
MISIYKHKQLTWYDLENPTQEEVKKLTLKYDLDLHIANELLFPSIRAKIDYGQNYIYLILHFPDSNFKSVDENYGLNEIDFIIGKDFLITTRYKNYESLHEFSKIFEVNSLLNKDKIAKNGGILFFYMLKNLYQNLFNQIQNTKDSILEIEEGIFKNKEKEMVFEISKQNRLLLRIKDSINDHQEVFDALEIIATKFFHEDFSFYIKKINLEYGKVKYSLLNIEKYLKDLATTNNAMLNTKQNEIMKIFTILAFVTFPLSLIAAIFGMNTETTPILGRPNDFIEVITIMAGLTLIMFIYFKIKKWF